MSVGLQPHEKKLAEQEAITLAAIDFGASKISDGPKVKFSTFPTDDSQSQHIDLSEENAVTHAIKEIERLARQDIAENQELQDLLAKDKWSYEDRCTWEKEVSKIVSERHNQVPGLDKYRNDGTAGITRVTDLKDLAKDVGANGPTKIEHDCESMRAIEGIVLTQLEKKLLPDTPSSDDDYKKNGAYVAVDGDVKYSLSQGVGGHAFLMSSLTGNIIEGTADPDNGQLPYNDTGAKYSYADFVAGRLATTRWVDDFDPNNPSTMTFTISVYGSRGGHDDDAIVQKREDLIKQGDFDGLNKAVFKQDTGLENENHFKDAFFHAGKATFTVKKPAEHDATKSNADDAKYRPYDERPPNPTYKEFIENNKPETTDSYDKAFLNGIHKALEDKGFVEKGQPIVITENGKSYLLSPEDGEIKIYDSTGKDIEGVPKLEIETKDGADPKPEPEPIEVCPQLGGVKFSELLDGKGILSDNDGYNDADAVKGMVQAAKDLGLPEAFYGHIEESMADNKFVSTAASIRAIKACHKAMEEADKAGLDDVDKERLIAKTFFENVTSEDLIVDTEAADDVEPFDPAEREEARKMAAELDADMADNAGCSAINPDPANTATWGMGIK